MTWALRPITLTVAQIDAQSQVSGGQAAMEHRTDHDDGRMGRLPMGVLPATLEPGGRRIRLAGGSEMRAAEAVPFERISEAPPRLPHPEPITVLVTGLHRRRWREVDTPATAQAIAGRATAVVLVTDPGHVRVVAGLASRLVDRGVRCWVSTDADSLYARAAAVASGLDWGFTPS
jgi:hypothetical protein